MTNRDLLIQRFIQEEIALSKKDISANAASRDWFLDKIRRKIEEKLDEGERIPQLNKETPFVRIGSYFKGTKVSDVDEFDILVVLDSNSGMFSQNGIVMGDGVGVANPCFKYDERFKKDDLSGVSPGKLLNWLKSIVQEVVDTFGGEAPIRDGQAVTARILSKNLAIDLIPAGKFTYRQNPDEHFYDIPKGDKYNGWILTKPESDIDLIRSYASRCDGLRNVIRVIKKINKAYNFKVPSFAVECCILYYAHNNSWDGSMFNNILNALKYYSTCLRLKVIKDTFDNKKNLLEHLEVNEWYASRVDSIVTVLENIPYYVDDENTAYTKLRDSLLNL